jgi:hypothetical protein
MLNSVANAFPAVCCGVSERMFKRYYSLRIGDSPRLAAESFNYRDIFRQYRFVFNPDVEAARRRRHRRRRNAL